MIKYILRKDNEHARLWVVAKYDGNKLLERTYFNRKSKAEAFQKVGGYIDGTYSYVKKKFYDGKKKIWFTPSWMK